MANIVSGAAQRWRARLPGILWRYAVLHKRLRRLYRAASATARAVARSSDGTGYATRRNGYAEALSRLDRLYGISRRTLELTASFGVAGPPTGVLPFILEHQHRLHEARLANLRPQRALRSPLRFGYLGALAPEKGAELLVREFRGIPPSVATLQFHGRSTPTAINEILSLCDTRNLPTFRGGFTQNALPEILGEIDIGIVPSLCEDTWPTTVREFQAAGVPVIGSNRGGIPEQIIHGHNGMLFDPAEKGALRATIDMVIARPEMINKWRHNLPDEFDPMTAWHAMESACYDTLAHGGVAKPT